VNQHQRNSVSINNNQMAAGIENNGVMAAAISAQRGVMAASRRNENNVEENNVSASKISKIINGGVKISISISIVMASAWHQQHQWRISINNQ
jgi:hypothetical protein